MSSKNFVLAGIFCTAISALTSAQSPEQNHDKYWYYRYRFLNNFILVGEGEGKSIPAIRRGPLYENETTGDFLVFNADETCEIGYYMAVLATEIKLLKRHNQDASETIKELYYALKAINRLDENAEYYYRGGNPNLPPVPLPGDLNGFFIRNDMKANFVANNWQHFNSGKVPSSFDVNRHHSSSTDNNNGVITNDPEPTEESLDQVINLMMGLAFVSEFVHDSYNGMDLNQEAKDITHRIVMYMKNSSPIGWVIKNPITGNLVGGGANSAGSAAYPYSYGFAEAACHIVKDPSGIFTTIYPIACTKYHDLTTTASFPIFQLLKDFLICPQADAWNVLGIFPNSNFPCAPCQEMYKPEMLAALGHCYYTCPFLQTNCYFDFIPAINVTGEFLSVQASSTNTGIIPLIHKALHGGINLIGNTKYETMLNQGPCGGPFNFGNCNYYTYEWSTPIRWRSPEQRGMGCPAEESDPNCHSNFFGEYNGLDYMLLFNLYSIVHEDYLSSYFNSMDKNITTDFPIPLIGSDFGSHTMPATIEAFNSITATNTIHSDGDIIYHAGEEIELLNGFGVEQGADFGAYVQPFLCNSTGDDYIRTSNDPGKPRTLYNEPTSHVYYASTNNVHIPFISSVSVVPPVAKIFSFENKISITPNPSSGLFTLEFKENTQGEVFIYNELGQIIYKSVASSTQLEIDISAQPRGIYFVKFQSGEKIYSGKVVVQ